MRPYRTILTVLAMAGGLLATPATASHEAVVEGRTTAWTDVTLKHRTTIRDVEITATGRYGGFYLTPRDRPYDRFRSYGEVVIDAFAVWGHAKPFPLGTSDPVLEPGKYRLYLIADDFTMVKLPGVTFGTGKALHPTRRTRATLDVGHLEDNDGSLERITPVATNRTVALSALQVHSQMPVGLSADVCLAPASFGECDGSAPTEETVDPQEEPYPGLDTYQRWFDSWPSPTPASGDYVAVQRLRHSFDVYYAIGAAFSLTLK